MMSHEREQARYHFTLVDMVDLIADYGYDKVMVDLENYIADKANNLISRALMEDQDETTL